MLYSWWIYIWQMYCCRRLRDLQTFITSATALSSVPSPEADLNSKHDYAFFFIFRIDQLTFKNNKLNCTKSFHNLQKYIPLQYNLSRPALNVFSTENFFSVTPFSYSFSGENILVSDNNFWERSLSATGVCVFNCSAMEQGRTMLVIYGGPQLQSDTSL